MNDDEPPLISAHAMHLKVMNYWQACDVIGDEEAARIWQDADADRDEHLPVPVPE